ncbi:MAG: alanyl-tRNA synthetase [Thermotogaceae bacterium]|jgi:alanyl-tRNA synthetase|nr:alanyl-tRNA synthetase [Thermotogaceae bacterium]
MFDDVFFDSKCVNKYQKKNEWVLELSTSQFYPDGEGGQLGDRGEINGVSVVSVLRDKGGTILHVMAEDVPCVEGEDVNCKISGENRYDIAQQHTAQHLISANFDNDLAVETVGFHMSENHTTIDLNTNDLSEELLEKMEKKLFQQITDLIAVDILTIPAKDIHKYPLRKGMSEKLVGIDQLRVVKIGDLDYSLCKGFHCKNTGNIGIIKIFKTETLKRAKGEGQERTTRIYFLAGNRALKDYQMSHQILKETTEFLSTSKEELQMRLQNLMDENKSVSKMSRRLSESLAKEMYQNIQARNVDGKRRIVKVLPSEESAKGLSKEIMKEPDTIAVFLFEKSKHNGFNIISTHEKIDAKEILNSLKDKLTIQGGGNSNMTLGVVHGNLEQVKDEVEKIINKY